MRDNPGMDETRQPRVQLATPGQLGALSGVLGRAFAADPMMTWPLGDVADPQRSIEACFRLLNAGSIEAGLVFEAAGGAGVAVWVPPDLTGRWAELDRLARPAIYALADDGGERYERLWDWVDQRVPAEPLWYLDQLGVDPARQGEGLGKALVQFGLVRAAGSGWSTRAAFPAAARGSGSCGMTPERPATRGAITSASNPGSGRVVR